MEDHRDPDLAPEPLGFSPNEVRLSGRVKEEAHVAGVALGKAVQLMGQREHDVVVGHGQELGVPGGEPALLGQRLTLWAVPVATGMIGVAQPPAALATLEVSAEGCRAAGFDSPQCSILHCSEPVPSAIGRAVACEHVRQFDLPCRIRCVRMRAHGTLAAP